MRAFKYWFLLWVFTLLRYKQNSTFCLLLELRQSAEGVDVLPDILGDGGGGGDGSSGNNSDTDDGGPAGKKGIN